jgi:hypothetical protein
MGPDFERFKFRRARSQAPATGYGTAPSRFGLGAGWSQDGWQSSPRLSLKNDDLQAGRKILGLRQMRVNFVEE